MSNTQIRVMLVDAHRLVLSGLQRLINEEKPEMAVIATATSAESALSLVHDAQPDIVIVDVGIATENDAAVIQGLAVASKTRVLVLGAAKGDAHEAAIVRGACGMVRTDDAPELLIKAIRKVHEGELWLDRSTTGRLFVELSRQRKSPAALDPNQQRVDSLTTREHEVVRVFVTQPGADNKTLASNLHIGEHTLRNHLTRIYDKLGVPNRVELYLFAQRHRLNGE